MTEMNLYYELEYGCSKIEMLFHLRNAEKTKEK